MDRSPQQQIAILTAKISQLTTQLTEAFRQDDLLDTKRKILLKIRKIEKELTELRLHKDSYTSSNE